MHRPHEAYLCDADASMYVIRIAFKRLTLIVQVIASSCVHAQRYRDTMADADAHVCARAGPDASDCYTIRAHGHATSCVAAAQSPDVPGAKIALVRAKRRRVARMLRL